MPRWTALNVLLLAVGGADAAIGRDWDHFALFASMLFVSAAGWIVSGWGRRVTVRGDLARWISQYASEGLESEREVIDRAVAMFRAGIVGTPADHRPGAGGRTTADR